MALLWNLNDSMYNEFTCFFVCVCVRTKHESFVLGLFHTMAVQVESPWDWMTKLCWESRKMGWKRPIKYMNWSFRTGIVWSLQKPSPKSKPFGYELPPPLDLGGHTVKPSKVKPIERERESILVYSLPKQPLQSNDQYLVSVLIFLWKKSNGLSTIVWVSNRVRPKLPSKVHCFGKKLLSCRHFEERRPFDFWPRVWRVNIPNYDFLQSDW